MSLLDALLTDRRLGTKLGFALALLVMGFSGARIAGTNRHPSLEDSQIRPERYHGRLVWVPAATVVRVSTDHFVIDTGKTQAVVQGDPGDLRAGDPVTVVARFDRRNLLVLGADGRWRRPRTRDWGWLRTLLVPFGGSAYRLMVGISALVVAGLGVWFVCLFRGRLAVPAFTTRTRENGEGKMENGLRAAGPG
jgi:hypothetical protein